MKTIAVSILVLGALAAAVLAPSSSAQGSLQPCGTVPIGSVYNVTASSGIACTKARKIIKKDIAGNHHPLGFSCHTGRQGQYGYGITCRRGSERVLGSSGV